MSLIKFTKQGAQDAGNLTQAELKVGLKVRKGDRKGVITRVDADGDPWVKFDDGNSGKVLLSQLAKDSACGQDAGVPSELSYAVGAIENALEKYSKTFSRYEDSLENKDFKRYNAIYHAAVNMHRAIQSA